MEHRIPMAYPKASTTGAGAVPASPRFPAIEEAVLKYWDADGTFQASIENRPAGENGDNEFVFYDGPPFANGLPHYGHLLTGYVKDIVPRYKTMRGMRVERRFGWDTHGLPAELEAMSQLGIKTKDEILDLGIEAFNAKCRESVMKYTHEWQDYVTRQARWVDFDNDYKTLNPTFMESVLWAFKSLYDKGYVYEGFRILPYCWNDQTPLSNHELRMDDEVYKIRKDPAVTVGYRLASGPYAGALALIWTTTPWTLPSNMGIAVGPDVDYVVVESEATGRTERYVLAAARLASYANDLWPGKAEDAVATRKDPSSRIVARLKGSDLVGSTYTPPFPYYVGYAGAHQVLGEDFVTTEDGTGIVHMSPGYGEEDKAALDKVGVETVLTVGPDGTFIFPVTAYEGVHVFDANPLITEHLKARTFVDGAGGQADPGPVTEGTVLLRKETYEHSYPHCWRCKQPLLYMAVSSWFVEVTKFKQRMMELNQEIDWTPDNVKDGQFGKWLENARDWSISRNRFWGSPIPVWRSDNPEYPRLDVYGSFAELEADFGVLPRNEKGEPDLHRPFIDELTRPNPDDPTGQSTMRRVEDVLDVWFDSGSMSFAQVHYPFENREWFEHHFPGDFIVEYIGQTRGWFYTLHILATALFDRPAFQSCISHGIVLGDDGQKMSKSLRNYPDVSEVFDRDGADAMRWFLMASPILRGGNLIVTEEGIRAGVRQALIPLWNAWYFFALYAGAAGYDAQWRTDSTDGLDRYILAKLREYVADSGAAQDVYDIPRACELTRSFLDVLSNWYIRRSRDRFWAAGGTVTQSSKDAFDTLYTVLEVVCRVAAPLLPLVTEEIWRGLTGGRSVHLTDWPNIYDLPEDHTLVAAMDRVHTVCSVGSSLRKAERLRTRLPLSSLTVVTADAAALRPFSAVIADELNVKSVDVRDVADAHQSDFGISQKLTVNARAAGPRLGKDVQVAIKGSKSGDWSIGDDGTVIAGGLPLVEGEYALETVVDTDGGGSVATGLLPGGGFVVLDTDVTLELELEGVARDLIRAVQGARRDAGLDVSDRIALIVTGGDFVNRAMEEHRDLIKGETLTSILEMSGDLDALTPGNPGVVEATVGDRYPVRLLIRR